MVAPLRLPCSFFRTLSVLCIFFLIVSPSFAAPRQQLTPISSPSVAELKARAEWGDTPAQQQLSQFLLRSDSTVPGYDLALAWLRAAAQSDPGAQFLLGYLCEHGHGVPRDYAKAAELYQAAALHGYSLAQNNLASLYQRGLGVPVDLSKAFNLYLAAAQRGNPPAQNNVGTLYFHGLGVTRDLPQAARWFRAAALLGHPIAQHNLGLLYLDGSGVDLDRAQGAHWITLSAEQGYPSAETDLAYLYEKGLGVPLDYVAAYTWYSRAIAAGDLAGKARLKSLSRIMTPKQLDRATTILHAQAAAPHDPALPFSSTESPYVSGR